VSPEPSYDVVVIGGGITGLTAAYDLVRRGCTPIVLEASGRAGGLIQTDHVDGLTIEAGPDSVLASKPAALALFDELGISPQVQHVRPPGGAFVLRGNRLYRLQSPSVLGLPRTWRALVRYDLLPLAARARLALEPLVPRRTSEEDESVASFFRRRFGAAAVDLIAQPLLGGIHAGDIEQLSMQSLFPRLLALEARHGSVLRKDASDLTCNDHADLTGNDLTGNDHTGNDHTDHTDRKDHQIFRSPNLQIPQSPFVSLRGGMHVLVDALLARLGDAVQLDSPVTRLERIDEGWRVHVLPPSGGRTVIGRTVIIAAPAFVAADLLRPLDLEAAALCAQMPYVSTASIALAWRRAAIPHPLTGTGFVVARRYSDVRITACTWVSQKWEHRAPEGTALMRAFIGGAHDPDVVDLDDAEIVEIARRDLARVLGVREAPAVARVYRWRRAGAQHLVGQLARMDALDTRLSYHGGLLVAGSGFRSVGIPDCIADAHRAATTAAQHHGNTPTE